MASLASDAQIGPDRHALLLSGLRAAPPDAGATRSRESDVLHDRLAGHVRASREIRSRVANRLGVHPDDLGVLMAGAEPRGALKATFWGRCSFDAWPAQD